jgi:hypothetical protein
MTTCRYCGQPIELDNVDYVFGLYDLPPELQGDFWRHSDTPEQLGLKLCPGTRRFTASARYAEPADATDERHH